MEGGRSLRFANRSLVSKRESPSADPKSAIFNAIVATSRLAGLTRCTTPASGRSRDLEELRARRWAIPSRSIKGEAEHRLHAPGKCAPTPRMLLLLIECSSRASNDMAMQATVNDESRRGSPRRLAHCRRPTILTTSSRFRVERLPHLACEPSPRTHPSCIAAPSCSQLWWKCSVARPLGS